MSTTVASAVPAWTIPDFLEVRDGHLAINCADALELVRQYHSPLFVFSEPRIRSNINRLKSAAKSVHHPIRFFYASKANSNLAVLRTVLESGIDVEVNMKIPRVTIRAAGQADKIIDNSTVRFTTLIKVPAIPKQGASLQLATRNGGAFECTVTRSDWSEDKSLFIVSCSYAKRSMSAEEYDALVNDAEWKSKPLF